ncbi:hypothetical protein HMPREF1860_01114 [Prevotella amnii]|uniref:Uncharacterized protein n=1 Tax=Prevotella amnii TaxID=419005 RepID=A0A134BDQ6_9BACT|nr:hypothetical protein HMPREF1860_01114 [Prevotella amnii]
MKCKINLFYFTFIKGLITFIKGKTLFFLYFFLKILRFTKKDITLQLQS